MSDKPEEAPPAKKGGGKMKIIIMVVVLLVLVGGGVGAGVYAASSGLIGGGHGAAAEDHGPKLVPKSEQKRPKAEGEGGEGGHGGGESSSHDSGGGKHVPSGGAGDRYASNYYTLEPSFTSNLQDSVHVVQIGLAISTPYDDTVIENLKTNDIAVRSAVLLTLGDTPEDQVFSASGKEQLQKRLAKSINDVLEQKEGFGGVSNVYFTNYVVQ